MPKPFDHASAAFPPPRTDSAARRVAPHRTRERWFRRMPATDVSRDALAMRLPVTSAACLLALSLAALPWATARADCRPDGVFEAGDTIVCSGFDGNGWPSEPAPPNTPEEDIPVWPIDNLTVIVNPGATVSSNDVAISIVGINGVVNNSGTVTATGAEVEGIGIAGFAAAVANNGSIATTGDLSEGVGIEGGSALVTNNGTITTTGDLAEGIGIEGNSARATNNNTITVSGDGAEGIGVEGSNARVTNAGAISISGSEAEGMGIEGANATATNSGTITTDGVETVGIGVEGNGASITNTGTIRTLQDVSAALGLLGSGSPGDKATVSNSGRLRIEGADSFGIGVVGGNLALTNEAAGRITLGGADSAGLAAIGFNGLVSSDSDISNNGSITGSGRDSDGILIFGFDNTATNQGTITLTGDRSVGMSVQQIAGGNGKTTVTNRSGATINISGAEATGMAGSRIGGGPFEIDNAGVISSDGADALGIAFEGALVEVTNATTGQLTVTGAQARAIVGGGDGSPADGAKVVNAGTIEVIDNAGGTGARGIEITGNDLEVANGLGAASTRLTVSGDDGIGIAVTGAGAEIDNDAPITMSGDRVRGIDVETQDGNATYRVVNRETIAVGGDDGAGIVFHAAPGVPPATTDPRQRLFINLDTIGLDGERTAGIAFDGMSSSTADNARTIRTDGTHAGARGIALAGGNDNFVTNFDSIDLNGAEVIGIDIAGNANTVLNGSGTTTFPNALIDPTGIALFPGAPPLVSEISIDDPNRTVVPIGEILVNGANAIGIRVSGADNRIGIRIQDDPASSTGLVPSKVIASGAGSAAVVLSGSGNVLVNDGLLSGQGSGVLGGNGADTVVNQNAIEGGVRLQGGADELIIADGSSIVGTADGGDGNDTLTVFVPTPATGFPILTPFIADGNSFVNFETATKIGGGGADLTGVLNVTDAGVFQGTLGLTSGSQLLAASNVTVQKPAASSVSSRLEVRAGSLVTAAAVDVGSGASICNGGTITGTLNVDSGATYSAGCSIGTATLIGDLVSAGLLEVEIAGLGPGAFDVFDISGDATFLGGEILFSFLDGFVPDLGDSFDFLRADLILGLNNVDFAFAGLPDGFDFDLTASSLGLRLLTAAVAGEPGDGQVPEPAALLLFGVGLAGMALVRRRRIARRAPAIENLAGAFSGSRRPQPRLS